MVSPSRIANYVAAGLAQLTSQFSKLRGALSTPAPTLAAISPATGPTAGGTLVYITGVSLDGAYSVTIGGVAATIISAGGSIIVAQTPIGTSGAKDVVVTTSGGSATLAAAFTYPGAATPPTVSSIAPNIGFFDGGDTVIIVGTNFTGSPTVSIGGVACTSVVVNSVTQITCVTGAKARSTGNSVLVTTTGGTNGANALYEYFDPTSPPGASATCVTYYTARHCTQGAGIVTAMPDSKGSNTGIIPGGTEPSYTATNAAFGNRPTFDFPASDTKRIKTTNAGGITTGARTMVYVSSGISGTNSFRVTQNLDLDRMYADSAGALHFTSDASNHEIITGNGLNGPAVCVFAEDGTVSARAYVNAQTATTGNAGLLQDMTGGTWALGNYGAGFAAGFDQTGSGAEFLLFSAALSDSDCKYIEVGYGKIYGFTIGP